MEKATIGTVLSKAEPKEKPKDENVYVLARDFTPYRAERFLGEHTDIESFLSARWKSCTVHVHDAINIATSRPVKLHRFTLYAPACVDGQTVTLFMIVTEIDADHFLCHDLLTKEELIRTYAPANRYAESCFG
jgi:hypothetical protein